MSKTEEACLDIKQVILGALKGIDDPDVRAACKILEDGEIVTTRTPEGQEMIGVWGKEAGMFVDCLVVGMLDDFEPSEGFTHVPVIVTKKED